MSAYCRQRADRNGGNRCDVTVIYTTAEGYSVLVARHRKVPGRQLSKLIGLSRDGKLIRHKTPHACAETLRALKDEGYCVPSDVIKRLSEEWLVPS